MNRKFKNALKSAYSIPEPQRKEVFLQGIEEDKKAVPFWIKLMKYTAVPVTAAIAVVISTSFMNVSEQREQYVEDAPVTVLTTVNADRVQEESESTQAAAEHTENTTVTSLCNADIVRTVSSTSETTSISASALPTTAKTSAKATTITTTTAKTASVTTITSVTTKTASTTMIATTTHMQTTPSPSTYTTMPTMTTVNYEPSYTMPTTTTPDYSVDEPIDIGRDFTVYPETSFRLQESIIDVSDYIDFSFSPEPVEPDDSVQDLTEWQYLAKNSDEAVYGKVVNSYYTAIEGLPYEQLDIMVEYPLGNGQLYYGDLISVYVPSEYMSLEYFIEEYNCAYLFEDMTEDEIAETTVYFPWTDVVSCYNGMDRLFFLNEDSGSAPDGAYRLTAGSVCSIFYSDGSDYICAADGSISFSMDEYYDFMGY